jgi:tetratricopeptide (TPR) repeat protein
MKIFAISLLAAAAVTAAAQPSGPMQMSPTNAGSQAREHLDTVEHLGTVSFPVSCSASVQASFNRGVALLHDFWYAEAQAQFERIAAVDPGCAMAHWGIAMSVFHEIWERPDPPTAKLGWEEIEKAQALRAKTEREREYIAALAAFYAPGNQDFMSRVTAYSAAMATLYKNNPGDVDAGAFYSLSLLASVPPKDTSLKLNREAMAVLVPLYASNPDNPGVDHYIIHACDSPAMAREGLTASVHYGEIAPSGAHAAHMPGHIFARLGMWQQDIDSQLASIRASEAAESHHESGLMDEPHSYDFLMYAYLQGGQDRNAKAVLGKVDSVLSRIAAMPGMGSDHMPGMVGYYQTKFPVFYTLERRDWQRAAALIPLEGALPQDAAITWWARAIADGHLHRAEQARADLAQYDALMAEAKKGPNAYEAEGTGAQIKRDEIVAWAGFAADKQNDAFQNMRMAADLQDKVGQGEVDIPAREMLADMLLELHQPQRALAEYRTALKLSPNRFNGLFNAGVAAEQAGDKPAAADFFSALLKSTGNGGASARPELAHARSFVSEKLASTPAL